MQSQPSLTKIPITEALLFLASRCDGAVERDGAGFNSQDTNHCKHLASVAMQRSLTQDEKNALFPRLYKYSGQLAEAGFEIDEKDCTKDPMVLAQEILDVCSAPEESEEPEEQVFSQPTHTVPPPPTQLPPPKPPEITLTEEQEVAANRILNWFDNINEDPNQEFKLGGFAGTGKTTLIKHVRKNLHVYAIVSAFTGKACHVLNKKGVAARTLHSLMYNPVDKGKGMVEFIKKSTIDDYPGVVIVDEASMLSTDLYRDLKSFDIPCLFVGDPGQLEPVGDNPNLMKNADFVLNRIHRQAESNPIIKFSQFIRLGGSPKYGTWGDNGELVVRNKKFTIGDAKDFDQVICAKNATRNGINYKMRQYLNMEPMTIVPKDKLICLRNNPNFGVFNGMIFYVESIKQDNAQTWLCETVDEVGYKRTLPIWKLPFQDESFDPKSNYPTRDMVYCDYGYCITCHKAQGSEWDKVLVFDEWMPPKLWDMKRWRYTAVTRAAKHLTLLMDIS